MVPRCYGIEDFEKGLHTTKKRTRFRVFDVFEKTRGISKQGHSYFLYVGVARCVTKLFRIEEENVCCREIQIGGNSFRKIKKSLGRVWRTRCFDNILMIWDPEFRFWGPKVCICMKIAVRIHLETSRGLKPP